MLKHALVYKSIQMHAFAGNSNSNSYSNSNSNSNSDSNSDSNSNTDILFYTYIQKQGMRSFCFFILCSLLLITAHSSPAFRGQNLYCA